jgi:hypothetical protein
MRRRSVPRGLTALALALACVLHLATPAAQWKLRLVTSGQVTIPR